MGDDDDEGNDVFIDKSCSPNSCHKRFFFTLPHQQFFEGKLLRIKLPIICAFIAVHHRRGENAKRQQERVSE